MESGKEENQGNVCHEGDEQNPHHHQEISQLSHQRMKTSIHAQTPVSRFISSFIVNMIYAFQDRENLYLFSDLMNGGDLRYHIGRKRRFTEEETSKCLIFRVHYKLFGHWARVSAQQ